MQEQGELEKRKNRMERKRKKKIGSLSLFLPLHMVSAALLSCIEVTPRMRERYHSMQVPHHVTSPISDTKSPSKKHHVEACM